MTKRPELKEVLPLGSVVSLFSEENLDYMIVSRGILVDEKTFKDYGAVLLPVGLTKDSYKLFDATDIEQVKFRGYVNRTEGEFEEKFKIWRNDFAARVDDVIEQSEKKETEER
ncbi:DUF4176 domain-containing protein [Fictibacillus gelatini]|uniref:DUF4176 domain-containing protein n=1 Tax=Fictibacillus gelatini TaxID=225985 RepID=UPI0003FAC298|nr:DUF4176 domain-containing protein [Fictibacillus gelatini]